LEISLDKYFERPYLEIPIIKRAGTVAQGEGPEFKPQYLKKKVCSQMSMSDHAQERKLRYPEQQGSSKKKVT
jgi:hypothetical protein